VRRARQLPLDVRRQAVGRDHVEARSGKQHHSGRARLGIERGETLEDGDLARDVDVVQPGLEARVNHRPRGPRKGAGAMDDEGRSAKPRAQRGPVIEAEASRFEPQLAPKRRDRFRAPAGQHGPQPAPHCLPSQQLARVAVGTVDQGR